MAALLGRAVACLVLLCLLISGLALPAAAHPGSERCTFALGFAALHDLIPQVVGECVEDEHHNPLNGDGLQQTTGGLLVWRKADNWTAFTNGATTWINGPCGLQSRPNAELFAWERGGGCDLPATIAPPLPEPRVGLGNCDPSYYPNLCIPSPPPLLGCADIPYRNFPVSGSDPHGFDPDHNGIGCEE